jgi:hypothetical protein
MLAMMTIHFFFGALWLFTNLAIVQGLRLRYRLTFPGPRQMVYMD